MYQREITQNKIWNRGDQEQFELEQLVNLLANAMLAGLTWSGRWLKFVVMEGSFTSPTVTNASFKIHTGKSGSDYNYTEVTLDLPSKALLEILFRQSFTLLRCFKF
jgi:hypothetical protein